MLCNLLCFIQSAGQVIYKLMSIYDIIYYANFPEGTMHLSVVCYWKVYEFGDWEMCDCLMLF